MKTALRVDYATFNLPAHVSDRDVCQVLAGRDDLFRRLNNRENSCLISPMGLHWNPNTGYEKLPRRLQVSGVGCEHFGVTLPLLRKKYCDDMTVSRIDFAFDVVMHENVWREFLVAAFSKSMDKSRKYRKFTLVANSDASTVYIGSVKRNGSKLLRIYNKSLESEKFNLYNEDGSVLSVPPEHYIIRYEMQCMRYRVTRGSGQVELFDPGVLFDLYFGSDSDFSSIVDFIKSNWISYGDDVVLPDDFQNFEFFRYFDTKELFCSKMC